MHYTGSLQDGTEFDSSIPRYTYLKKNNDELSRGAVNFCIKMY